MVLGRFTNVSDEWSHILEGVHLDLMPIEDVVHQLPTRNIDLFGKFRNHN